MVNEVKRCIIKNFKLVDGKLSEDTKKQMAKQSANSEVKNMFTDFKETKTLKQVIADGDNKHN